MDYAQQLAFFANILEQKRLVTALEGNASIIDRETGLTYITPSGRMKLLLQREDISVMDESGAQIGGRGKRSSEYLLHEAVYRARPDVNARRALPLPVSDGVCAAVPGLYRPGGLLAARCISAVRVPALRQKRDARDPQGHRGRAGAQPALPARRTRRCMCERFHGKLHRSAGSGGRAGEDAVGGEADLKFSA